MYYASKYNYIVNIDWLQLIAFYNLYQFFPCSERLNLFPFRFEIIEIWVYKVEDDSLRNLDKDHI